MGLILGFDPPLGKRLLDHPLGEPADQSGARLSAVLIGHWLEAARRTACRLVMTR
jgi:hypothetical protein